MKKRNIILLSLFGFLTLTMSFHTFAQTKVWSVGPEVGLSLSRYGKDASTNDFKSGAIGGMFLTYSILNTFAVTTKFLYSQKGASFESPRPSPWHQKTHGDLNMSDLDATSRGQFLGFAGAAGISTPLASFGGGNIDFFPA